MSYQFKEHAEALFQSIDHLNKSDKDQEVRIRNNEKELAIMKNQMQTRTRNTAILISSIIGVIAIIVSVLVAIFTK